MRAVVLFAGAGGACIGLRDAGIEHALGVERDEDASESSRSAGFPTVTGDVRDLALYEDVEELDLLWSSFPCQDFSTAGSRAGAKGERNGWPWTVNVIDHLSDEETSRPRWFLAENVTGLTMHIGGCPTREGKEQEDPTSCPRCYLDSVIMPQLRERYAWADWRVLDAADFGVPQRRRRVIIAAGPHPIEWPEPTHSGEALAKAKWVTKDYWQSQPPIGEPSAQEQRWLASRNQLGLFSTEPARFGLKPWATVRQALGLGGTLEASRNTSANPAQERPITTDEPIFAVGGKGNQYLTMERGRDGKGGGTNSERRSVDEPSVSISGASGGSTRPMLETRVLGGGHNPNHSADHGRNLRDITDEPCTTVAAQRGGGAGNAGPFVEKWRKASHPGLLDMPSPIVSSTEVKGTNGKESTGWTAQGGPCRASDALWLSTGRRRLTVEECAVLQDFPSDYLWHGTKTAQYRQVGNAVPPRLAEAVARAVLVAEASSRPGAER